MTIPVIILNYNSNNDCAKCISFLQQQEGVMLEIIVVDNNSSEDDLTALRVICSDTKCTLLESKENRGYNAGNNIGLRYAAQKGYTYALIANPDMEFPLYTYIKTLVDEIEREPNAVIVASDIVTPEGRHENPIKREDSWFGAFKWLFRKLPFQCFDYQQNQRCIQVSGCCFLIRMDFVQKINFFDEHVFLYNEEPILSRQVEAAGKCMYYTSSVYAKHCHIDNAKGSLVKRLQYYKCSYDYFVSHYSGYTQLGRWAAKFSTTCYVKLLLWYKRLKTKQP